MGYLNIEDRDRGLRLSSKFADLAMLDRGESSAAHLRLTEAARQYCETVGEREWGRNVLVLGATGYVGTHLVHQLLRDSRVEQVFAIVRVSPGITPTQRVIAAFGDYGLALDTVELGKLRCIEGQITARHFGLSQDSYAELGTKVDSVISSGSSTDYTVSYIALREDWVAGLMRVVQFCLDGLPKQLTYLGSTIARLYQDPAAFRRRDSWWYSGYAQMKWVNQTLLAKLNGQGLRITVCESPYVLGSTSLGRDPGLHYSFWRGINVTRSLRLIWNGEGMNFVPVDVLVGSIVHNLFSPSPMPVLRPGNLEGYSLESIAGLLGCEVVDWPDFYSVVRKIHFAGIANLLPEDTPEIIGKTNVAPLFPEDYPITDMPTPQALINYYLTRVDFDKMPRISRRLVRDAAAARNTA